MLQAMEDSQGQLKSETMWRGQWEDPEWQQHQRGSRHKEVSERKAEELRRASQVISADREASQPRGLKLDGGLWERRGGELQGRQHGKGASGTTPCHQSWVLRRPRLLRRKNRL